MRKILTRVLRHLGLIRFDLTTRRIDRFPANDEVTPGEMLIVESDGVRKWVCFKCPGGCKEKISLSLNQKRRPRWEISNDWFGRPTISPSIHQQNECGCHFWVRSGRVEWCPGGRPDRMQ